MKSHLIKTLLLSTTTHLSTPHAKVTKQERLHITRAILEIKKQVVAIEQVIGNVPGEVPTAALTHEVNPTPAPIQNLKEHPDIERLNNLVKSMTKQMELMKKDHKQMQHNVEQSLFDSPKSSICKSDTHCPEGFICVDQKCVNSATYLQSNHNPPGMAQRLLDRQKGIPEVDRNHEIETEVDIRRDREMRQRQAQSEWEKNRPKTKMELEQEQFQKMEEQRLLEEKEKASKRTFTNFAKSFLAGFFFWSWWASLLILDLVIFTRLIAALDPSLGRQSRRLHNKMYALQRDRKTKKIPLFSLFGTMVLRDQDHLARLTDIYMTSTLSGLFCLIVTRCPGMFLDADGVINTITTALIVMFRALAVLMFFIADDFAGPPESYEEARGEVEVPRRVATRELSSSHRPSPPAAREYSPVNLRREDSERNARSHSVRRVRSMGGREHSEY